MTDPGVSTPAVTRTLLLLASAMVLSMSTWFSASAVLPQLRGLWSLSRPARPRG